MTAPIVDVVDPISALAALLGDHLADRDQLDAALVFGHELPDDQGDLMPRKCLVVSGAGGPGSGGYLPLAAQRVDLRAYGATHAEAMDVAVAANNVLKYLRRTRQGNVLVHGVDPVSGYVTTREPEARWPLVLRSYQALYDERVVA